MTQSEESVLEAVSTSNCIHGSRCLRRTALQLGGSMVTEGILPPLGKQSLLLRGCGRGEGGHNHSSAATAVLIFPLKKQKPSVLIGSALEQKGWKLFASPGLRPECGAPCQQTCGTLAFVSATDRTGGCTGDSKYTGQSRKSGQSGKKLKKPSKVKKENL